MKKRKTPRQFSLCKFLIPKYEHEYYESIYPKDLLYGPHYFFGQIPNMPDHCIVMSEASRIIYTGMHTENFVELDGDEI